MRQEIENKNRIRHALTELLTRTNEDSFVIIEEKSSEKFVQFAGGPKEGILFDLPVVTLSSSEFERAKILLQGYNIVLERNDVLDKPGGTHIGYHDTFQSDLANNIDLATEIAWRVLKEVYEFKNDFDMVLTEN